MPQCINGRNALNISVFLSASAPFALDKLFQNPSGSLGIDWDKLGPHSNMLHKEGAEESNKVERVQKRATKMIRDLESDSAL